MSTNITERVENSFKQLTSAAQALSSASDELGKVIRQLDASLKKLALGITVWVELSRSSDETQYWTSELGYAKIDGKWGIALREIIGYHLDNEEDSSEVWAFNDAPRTLRTEAVAKIPDLLDKMLHQTEETTKDLRSKIAQASELATVVSGLVPKAPLAPSQQWHRAGLEAPPSAPSSESKSASEPEGHTAAKPAAESAPRPVARFREAEALPAERTLPTERSLPAERPLPAERIS